MQRPFPAYRGDESYVFVCYSHDDANLVYPDIAWLQDEGVNLWYDEGISAGQIWRAELAQAIERADRILFYVSESSLASIHCKREISFALDKAKMILPVYLEDVYLTDDLALALGHVQALVRARRTKDLYRDQLLAWARNPAASIGETSRTRRPGHWASLKRTWAALGLAALLALISVGALRRHDAIVQLADTDSELTHADILHRWCSGDVQLQFQPDRIVWTVENGYLTYPVRAYIIHTDTIQVVFDDRGRTLGTFWRALGESVLDRIALQTRPTIPVALEFGKFSESKESMVQIRGQMEFNQSWQTYMREFKRC